MWMDMDTDAVHLRKEHNRLDANKPRAQTDQTCLRHRYFNVTWTSAGRAGATGRGSMEYVAPNLDDATFEFEDYMEPRWAAHSLCTCRVALWHPKRLRFLPLSLRQSREWRDAVGRETMGHCSA